jgi:D-alanyl-lipoteichoic acid acyltransferase DltB (MBOAT superfamily)
MKIRNTFIIFLKWFWHGANWTFIAWGFINALYFFAVVTLNKTDQHGTVSLQWDLSSSVFKHLSTFALTCLGYFLELNQLRCF